MCQKYSSNTIVHNVMPPSGLRLRLRRSLDHAKGGKLQQHGNWGIYHFDFSISPQDYGFDKQYFNWIVRGPPEHYGLQITCNMCIYIHIYITLLYSCWSVTLLREHNYILGMLECLSPVYGKSQEHVLNTWDTQIYTLISKNPTHMNHPLEDMSNVATVFEK